MKTLIALALNKALSSDPESFSRLKKLENKIVRLTIEPINFSLSLRITSAGFEIYEGDLADIKISGKPSSFVKLAQQKNLSLYQSGITIIGDMGLAEEIKVILSETDFDWESVMADHIGDVPARQLHRAAKAGLRFATTTGQQLKQDITEYLQEEIRVLPTRVEMDIFTQENAKLRDAVARLAAKL